MTNDENLREALIDLAKARNREEDLRLESDSLIEGIRVLIEPADTESMFGELLEVMRGVLQFEHACVLVGDGSGHLVPAATTTDYFSNTRWSPEEKFNRILSGTPVAYFDIAAIPEWQAQPASLRDQVTSALHSPLRSGSNPAMLVCTHKAPSHFSSMHFNLVKRFAPLAAQALMNQDARELLIRQDMLEKEKATIQATNKLLQQARDEALSASRAKSGFLASMSHEIRTPMNAVLGILGLLKETSLTSEQKKLVKTARNSGELLLNIINDVLDFSKMEADRIELENSVFDLHELYHQSVAVLRHNAEEKGLAIVLNLNSNIPQFVRSDSGRLRQIVFNLISNAIKFTDTGKIEIKVMVGPTFAEDRCELYCEINDTGIGIPEAQRETLFDEFTQADQSYSRAHEGTGLGLAICKRLVLLMNGSIDCQSAPDKGSSFFFTIEVENVSELDNDLLPIPNQDDILSVPRGGARVLLVEDNPANQLVVKNILERSALHVDVAGNGKEAVAAASKLNYDIILMDISMPEMNGMEATQQIRQFPNETKKIPIVALTAHALQGDRDRFIASGMDDYLTKPVNRSEMLDCIARWVGHEADVETQESISGSGCMEKENHYHVDEMVLLQLAKDTSPEIVPELIAFYIQDAKARVEAIECAVQEEDIEVLEFQTHTLGSSSAAHGNKSLYTLSRQIEHCCQSGDQVQALSLARELSATAVIAFQQLEERSEQGFG